MSRPPSPPPELPGFTYVEPLGAGGFADVFLYEQQMPRRKVAVKVLLADRIASGAVREFTDEANVMAMLSTHPAIVTIYQAGVAADGRPYLVMEYCPRPNLQIRARKEPFPVAEALRVGVQVAGAVETAHRAGVLHRDIKPANILVTEYNRPALTDFGIASTTGAVSDAAGMSIPWSPPESFADPPSSGPRSDVYALGATVYTLLTGRSPFERPGERNTSVDLIERIERSPLAPLGRADAPASLQMALERAMAKNPDDRFPSAVAFARALQKVQIELSHSVTSVDIVDDHVPDDPHDDDDDGRTRVRDITHIDPDAGSTRPSATTRQIPGAPSLPPMFESVALPSAADPVIEPSTVAETQVRAPKTIAPTSLDEQTALRPPRELAPTVTAAGASGFSAPQPETPLRPATPPASSDDRPVKKTSRTVLWILLAAAAAIVVGVGAVWGVQSLNAAPAPLPTPGEHTAPAPDPVTIGGGVPQITDVTAERHGEDIVFTWTNPRPEEGDSYLWYIVDLRDEITPSRVTEERVVVPAAGEICIEVILRRDNGRSSQPFRECAS